ncbi:hypothetical protein V8F33_004417 [Rhypophila sp. PSN 637]
MGDTLFPSLGGLVPYLILVRKVDGDLLLLLNCGNRNVLPLGWASSATCDRGLFALPVSFCQFHCEVVISSAVFIIVVARPDLESVYGQSHGHGPTDMPKLEFPGKHVVVDRVVPSNLESTVKRFILIFILHVGELRDKLCLNCWTAHGIRSNKILEGKGSHWLLGDGRLCCRAGAGIFRGSTTSSACWGGADLSCWSRSKGNRLGGFRGSTPRASCLDITLCWRG